MRKRIFRAIFTVAMTVLLTSLALTTGFLYTYFNKAQIGQLKDELAVVADHVNELGVAYFDNLDSSIFRFTLVSRDGTVLYDTKAVASEMENHLDREEITEAIQSGSGSSARYSSTLTARTLYEAVRLENGMVLRISASQVTVSVLLLGMLPAVMVIIVMAMIISSVLSHRMAKSIVKPLEELDLDSPFENDTYAELSPILTKLHKQRRQIQKQMNQLHQKADEFEQVTAFMSEGLVLLDKKGIVLSMNPAAKRLFAVEGDPIGRDFLTVDRSVNMSHAVETALHGRHNSFHEQRDGNEFQFNISRIASDGKTIGVIILCFDVTEAAFAERNRREFTANVSHELKTPLQSIIGSAELLESGLVKPEDTAQFISNIKNEATRLVLLIEDIIRLSQLDENSAPAMESVDLYEVAAEVIEVLQKAAHKQQVALVLRGKPCIIHGIHRYLYEIVYNLCDNAIRYNTVGGNVTIEVFEQNSRVMLSVSDTGIGIPLEHQARVFERFYRVDKSHSKETGGTGLGLSIVKHAVNYHGGTITLNSTVGKGTTITVVF